jgi:hypothetical protein
MGGALRRREAHGIKLWNKHERARRFDIKNKSTF